METHTACVCGADRPGQTNVYLPEVQYTLSLGSAISCLRNCAVLVRSTIVLATYISRAEVRVHTLLTCPAPATDRGDASFWHHDEEGRTGCKITRGHG